MRLGVGAAVREHRLGDERCGPDHDVGFGEPFCAPERDQIGGPGSGTDERDHGALTRVAGMTTVARYEAGRAAAEATETHPPPGSPSISPTTAPSRRSCLWTA